MEIMRLKFAHTVFPGTAVQFGGGGTKVGTVRLFVTGERCGRTSG